MDLGVVQDLIRPAAIQAKSGIATSAPGRRCTAIQSVLGAGDPLRGGERRREAVIAQDLLRLRRVVGGAAVGVSEQRRRAAGLGCDAVAARADLIDRLRALEPGKDRVGVRVAAVVREIHRAADLVPGEHLALGSRGRVEIGE